MISASVWCSLSSIISWLSCMRNSSERGATGNVSSQFFRRESLLAVNKPRDNRKKKTRRYATHQHADDALERPERAPVVRESYVVASERGITTRGEVDRR